MKQNRCLSICKIEILCYLVICFLGGLCLSLIKCSKTILPLCFTKKYWLVCPVFFLVFFPNLTRKEQRNSRSAASKGYGRYMAFFSCKKHCFRNHTVMRFIPPITSTPSLARSSHHALFPLCSVCVRVSENETAKSPRGEMLYLLRTTSQGHSRGQIKLLPASEGVAQNV